MTRQRLSAFALALVLILSVFSGAAVASENAKFGGTSVGNADQTSTTYVDEGTDLDNVTVAMTEDQSVAAGGSVTFDTAHTATDATIVSSSGSGTLEVTVNSDTVVVSETGGSSSATLEELNIKFDVVNSTDQDGIPAIESQVMNESAELVSDNENSEIHSFYIYDAEDMLDTEYTFSNGNYSDAAYDPASLDETTVMDVNLTRNETVHKNVPLEYAKVVLEFDESYMENVTDNTSASGITREDKATAGDFVKYVYSIDSPDATSESDTYELSFEFQPTADTGEDAIVVTDKFDPEGGAASEEQYAIDFGAGSTSGLSFFNSDSVPFWITGLGGLVIVGALGGIVYYRGNSMGMSNLWGLAAFGGVSGIAISLGLLIPGITMVVDTILGTGDLFGVELTFWTDLVTGFGLPSITPFILGSLLIGGFVWMNREFAMG